MIKNIALANSLLLCLMVSLPVHAASFKGKVITVIDGDTLMVLKDQTPEKIVLYAIDCPELAQDMGAPAKQFTSSRCYHKIVTIEDHGRDNYGRTIGEVFLEDGSNLNKDLAANGLAWWTKKYAPDASEYKELEQAARTAQKGLWIAASPVPPWVFRNGKRLRSVHATIKQN